MGLLDGDAGPLPSKLPRNLTLAALLIIAVGTPLYFLLRYHKETGTARHFLTQVQSGDYQAAYQTWRPGPSYSFQDFMRDWGPNGEYGPVKSFDLLSARSPSKASGVVVTVSVSAVSPFPGSDDPNSLKTKQVRLWIEFRDQSMSYAPEEIRIAR